MGFVTQVSACYGADAGHWSNWRGLGLKEIKVTCCRSDKWPPLQGGKEANCPRGGRRPGLPMRRVDRALSSAVLPMGVRARMLPQHQNSAGRYLCAIGDESLGNPCVPSPCVSRWLSSPFLQDSPWKPAWDGPHTPFPSLGPFDKQVASRF